MKKEAGDKDTVGDSDTNAATPDNFILGQLRSQELLSSAVPDQASYVTREVDSVQASHVPCEVTTFERPTKNDNVIPEPLHSQELLPILDPFHRLPLVGASYVPREDTDSEGSTKHDNFKLEIETHLTTLFPVEAMCCSSASITEKVDLAPTIVEKSKVPMENVMKKKLCCHAIDIDEQIDTDSSSTENEGENTSIHRWIKSKIKPKNMLMVKDNLTFVRELESYKKWNIKKGGRGKQKIQKVPAILRKVESNKQCYDPMIVAIGPYHHDKSNLKQMDFKIQFTLQYASQSGKSIRTLYEEMQKLLVKAKNYYPEDVTNFNNEEFAKMMFLDSCFVIQFMDSCVDPKNNDIKTTNIDTAFIMRDIMLLENQLPLKILTKLMCLSSRFEGGKGFKMIDDFIKLIMKDPRTEEEAPRRKTCFWFCQTNSKSEGTSRKKKKPIHLLELVQTKFVDDTEIKNSIIKKDPHAEKKAPRRKSCVWFREPNHMATCSMQVDVNREIKNETSDKPPLYWCLYRSVKELKSVGIHFRPSKSCQFSDITFKSMHLYGWLKLPRITIEDGTKSLLLNLVAFESCADTSSNFGVSSYVYFMDTLIDHAEDVKELRSKGIILNLLGNDEQVAELFNEISENLVPDFRVFGTVKKSLNAFYKSHRRLWLTECLHDHFRSPWAIIAFLAAIVVVCLTITQTIFSAIQL